MPLGLSVITTGEKRKFAWCVKEKYQNLTFLFVIVMRYIVKIVLERYLPWKICVGHAMPQLTNQDP